MVKIGKRFKWEMGHRLLKSYSEPCQNLHGHSYEMEVIIEGTLNQDGVVLDFGLLKEIVSPIVESLDHSLVLCKDDVLVPIISEQGLKLNVVPYNPTAENMAIDIVESIMSHFADVEGINSVTVKIWETRTGWVEASMTKEEFFAKLEENDNEVQG